MKTDEQTIKQMMMDGKSDIQIAKAVHVGRTRLAHLRRQFGIDCFKKLFVASLDELKEVVQNVNSGMSTLTKEASLRGVSRVTLARAIKKAGLSVREYRHKNPEGIDGYELTDRQW